MKLFSHNNRFGSSILILLIVLSILGVFLSMYNIVVESGGKISGLSVVLVIFSVLLSLFILRLIYRLQGDITHLTQQFERLKKNVEEAKIQESSTVEKQSDETKQAVDDLAVDSRVWADNMVLHRTLLAWVLHFKTLRRHTGMSALQR